MAMRFLCVRIKAFIIFNRYKIVIGVRVFFFIQSFIFSIFHLLSRLMYRILLDVIIFHYPHKIIRILLWRCLKFHIWLFAKLLRFLTQNISLIIDFDQYLYFMSLFYFEIFKSLVFKNKKTLSSRLTSMQMTWHFQKIFFMKICHSTEMGFLSLL